jgi:hypothetical protein
MFAFSSQPKRLLHRRWRVKQSLGGPEQVFWAMPTRGTPYPSNEHWTISKNQEGEPCQTKNILWTHCKS